MTALPTRTGTTGRPLAKSAGVPRYEDGSVHVVGYPFIRDGFDAIDADGPFRSVSWRPGTRFVWCLPDSAEAVCDGMGKAKYTVISTHKPGRYPTRVFYTRQWVTPAGHRFGKNNLHIVTQSCFSGLLKGYRHDFRLAEPSKTAEHEAQLKAKAT